MKKIIVIMALFLTVFLSSCTVARMGTLENIQDMQKKLATGEGVTTATFDYDSEKVYDAVKYVLLNTNVWAIASIAHTQFSHLKFYDKERAIVIMFYYATSRDVEIAIFFEQQDRMKTKVQFVRNVNKSYLSVLSAQQESAIKYIIDEANFVLKNDGKGYMKYTDENSVKNSDEDRKQLYKPGWQQ